MSPRGVYPRRKLPVTPHTIRTLRADEPAPEGEPRRYAAPGGYVRLRWKVGTRSYVDRLEHREVVKADHGYHVHHIDHDRTNNDPANLVQLTPEEHMALHAAERSVVDVPRAVELYLSGLSTVEVGRILGVDPSNIYRRLAPLGVIRGMAEAGILRRAVDDEARVVALHEYGLNGCQIARLMHVGRDAVRLCLRRHGISGRRPGRPTLAQLELEESMRA